MRCNSRTTVRPPMPLSITPMGLPAFNMVESLLFLSINIVPRAHKNARDKSFLLFVTNLGKRIAILPSPDKIVSGESWVFYCPKPVEMSRNVQSGNTQNLKSMVIQRSFPKWSVAERRKTAAASDQAAVCACAHSRYFAGGSPSGLRV